MALIIVLINKSELAPVSDYRYEVLVGDGTEKGSRTLEEGMVIGHTREEGWEVLLRKMLNERVKLYETKNVLAALQPVRSEETREGRLDSPPE